MGSLTLPDGATAYLDTNIVIAFVETDRWDLLDVFDMAAAHQSRLVTSDLTLAEVLVKPMKEGLDLMIDVYKAFLTSGDVLTVAPIGQDVLAEAARLRASLGNKLPDAIHVATASLHGCTAFVSDDRKVKLPTGMERRSSDQLTGLFQS